MNRVIKNTKKYLFTINTPHVLLLIINRFNHFFESINANIAANGAFVVLNCPDSSIIT